MIRILAIGNSFSQDATAYLHQIAKAGGRDCMVVNLYIGGCSLKTHWNNILSDAALYEYELNGNFTGRMISIKEALVQEPWDYITLQQVSGDSGIWDTYHPYITSVADYVRQYAPSAELLLHQTWAYETDSQHPDYINYNCDQNTMYQAIIRTYKHLSEQLSLRVIPCGEVIQALRSGSPFDYGNGGISLCRDGFHMNLVQGRYALAATWYVFLFRSSPSANSYLPPSEISAPVLRTQLETIKETVMDIVGSLW